MSLVSRNSVKSNKVYLTAVFWFPFKVKMPAGNAEEISAKLDEATANIDVLISSGDPDAALNAIGGVASAMSAQSAQQDSEQNEETTSEEEQKKQKEVRFALCDADVSRVFTKPI